MGKSKCCGWRDPKITRQGDILLISDRHNPKPHPHCMTCGLSCEVIPEATPTKENLSQEGLTPKKDGK
jgi:hypothetical protein